VTTHKYAFYTDLDYHFFKSLFFICILLLVHFHKIFKFSKERDKTIAAQWAALLNRYFT